MQVTRLTDNGKAGQIAISPDGRYVAWVVRDGELQSLWVRQVATGSDIQIVPPKIVYFTGVSFSTDGNYLYFAHSWENNFNFNALYQIPSLGGSPTQIAAYADTSAGFSPDGKQIAYLNGDPREGVWYLYLSNRDGSNVRTLAKIHAEISVFPGLSIPVWSPDGKSLALSVLQQGKAQHSLLTLVSTADGVYRTLLPGSPGEYFGQPAWLPDGRGLLLPIQDAAPGLRGQIWFVSYPNGKRRRFTNDPTDYSVCCMGLTADGKTLAVAQNDITANLWIASTERAGDLHQITSGEPHRFASWFSKSKIVTQDGDGHIVVMDPDGGQASRLLLRPAPSALPFVCAHGRYFVYSSIDESGSSLWRVDAPDGRNPMRLSNDSTVAAASCSSDGRWVVYSKSSQKGYSAMRVSMQRGDSFTLSQHTEIDQAGPPIRQISPDSKMVAVPTEDWQGGPNTVEILALETGTLLHRFVRPAELTFIFQWAPNGKAIDYIQTKGGVSNIWEQPLTGSPPRQLTHFTSDEITDFDWSPDGKQLLLSRGHSSRNVFLLSNFH
jgi:Tol biopolymer transport system component